MDAGVPSRTGGISPWAHRRERRYAILSDIQGVEDLGDMDFRVTPSRGHHRAPDGHEDRAFPPRHPVAGLTQARAGRIHILAKMETIAEPRTEMQYAPRITTMHVDPTRSARSPAPAAR